MLRLWLEVMDGVKKTIELQAIEEASAHVRLFVEEHNLGSKLFIPGLVYQAPYEDTLDILAVVSFHGAIWPRTAPHVAEYLNKTLPAHRAERFCTLPPWAVKLWIDPPMPWPGIVGAFQSEFAGDPLADILAVVDHQLSTDSDLDEIGGAAKYQALRQGIRDAMARKLGFSGYQKA
jgi:hypothetical protein